MQKAEKNREKIEQAREVPAFRESAGLTRPDRISLAAQSGAGNS
jgi:hypothetical protein